MPKLAVRYLPIYLSEINSAAPGDTITSITNASPPVVVPGTPASYQDADVVYINGTGITELDEKYFFVNNASGTDFELACTDLSALAAGATTGTIKRYRFKDPSPNMVRWCLNTYSWDQPAADAIDLSDFCGDESASGTPQPKTYSVGGWSDGCRPGFLEMMRALNDSKPRVMVIERPTDPPGYYVQEVDVSSFSESFERGSGQAFTSGGAIRKGPFDATCLSCVDLFAVTAAVAGTGTTSATITFAGGPSDADYTVTLTASTGTGAIVGLTPVNITKGMTAAQVATAVAAELNGAQDAGAQDTLAASAAGGVVTVTSSGASTTVASLTAVIA